MIYSQPVLWKKATESLENYGLFDTKGEIKRAIKIASIQSLTALAKRSNHFDIEVISLAERHILGSSKRERTSFWNAYIHDFLGNLISTT